MVKVLIGNKNIQEDLQNFQFLKNNNEYELITSNTGKDIINKCLTIKPNIIILDSNIDDMQYTDIIDRLSTLPEENNKCNLLLTVNRPEDKQLLKHTSILYEILDYPLDENFARKTINDLKIKYQIPDIKVVEINTILLALGIHPYSLGSQCLVSAIFKCYYHPEYFYTLDNVYKIVAQEFNITKEDVKNKIRHTIDTVNTSINIDGQDLYLKIFGRLKKVSAKIFIQMFVNYLNIIKSKN